MALQHRPNSTDTPVSITRNARHYVSTKREFERQLVGEALANRPQNADVSTQLYRCASAHFRAQSTAAFRASCWSLP